MYIYVCMYVYMYVYICMYVFICMYNWGSLYARLNCYYEAWNYKKKKQKNI